MPTSFYFKQKIEFVNVLEDLAESEEERCGGQIYHRTCLAKDSDNKNGLEDKEGDDEDQRDKLIKDVEGDVSVIRTLVAIIPVAGPREASVEGDVTSSNKQDASREYDECDREGGSVVDDLVANNCIEH
ncbi:hypothetical protein HG530_008811 [Fusarium avenaceum]|nr:hypothetical protein HG530_008811 [Fusarium avenaceum]